KRGEPDPLPAHPGQEALRELKKVMQLSSPQERKEHLKRLPAQAWEVYLPARRYYDAVQRNALIEQPERVPDKLERVRALVRLKYGTPHYETEAWVDRVLES
ncbi:MAG: hypothetical protein GY797_33300, partial [Deltaproteobacteria bacterium]|nr:hypothetical protein [Deltaproteobacteria bacterium]